jgi:hypothetical protein
MWPSTWCLRMVAGASCLLLVTCALEWWLIDLVTPFLFPPLLLLVVIAYVASAVWGLVHAVRHRRQGWSAMAPLLVATAVGALVLLTPFTDLSLNLNYCWYRGARIRIVQDVQTGRLAPAKRGVLALGSREPYVSMGGNDLLVEEHEGRRYVLFFTYRGVLDHYSGFLFVPNGGDPTQFADLAEARSTQIRQLDPGWYFVTHW